MKKIVVCLLALTAVGFFFTNCTQSQGEGYQLASKHCQSCHRLPEPGSLNKKTWLHYVLPKMGSFMGFRRFDNGNYFENGHSGEAMPRADWNKIVAYYVTQAPDSLAEGQREKIAINLKQFDVAFPSFGTHDPATTYVGIFPDKQQIAFG
ncbi:MAG TPA: hypothetical protein VFL47_08850, partial [Flavisolibacter sp.]|nr:hypothetical protein [Flavisolibacter sp.]